MPAIALRGGGRLGEVQADRLAVEVVGQVDGDARRVGVDGEVDVDRHARRARPAAGRGDQRDAHRAGRAARRIASIMRRSL